MCAWGRVCALGAGNNAGRDKTVRRVPLGGSGLSWLAAAPADINTASMVAFCINNSDSIELVVVIACDCGFVP